MMGSTAGLCRDSVWGCKLNHYTRSKVAFLFLMIWLLMNPSLIQAHFPALYGKEFVRSEQALQDEQPSKPKTPLAPMDKTDADAYQQQMEAQELQDGPFADALVESLSSLGRYHRDRGDYRKAEDLYKRALHIVRVNDGLYSERQVPLVRDLLNLHRTTGDLEALDDRYHYFFRLYGSGQPPYTAVRKRAILEYLRWQRAAHSSGLDGARNKRVVKLYQINEQMLETVAQMPKLEKSWQRELVLSQIRNLYLLLGSNSSVNSSVSGGIDAHLQQKMLLLQRTGLATGSNLLKDLIAQSAQLDPIELAGLHLELGDWYQWNELLRRADGEYAIVEQILMDAGETVLLNQWLGEPVELPDNDAFRLPGLRSDDAKPVVVTVRYDISAKGYLSNVEVSTQEPGDASVGSRIKRMLRESHFRPRFVAGHAEPMENLTRQYHLVH